MTKEREVAGIRCTGVLAKLADYLQDDLPRSERAQLEAHLAGCEWCTKFGGEYAAVVGGLRSALISPKDADAARTLAERLLADGE